MMDEDCRCVRCEEEKSATSCKLQLFSFHVCDIFDLEIFNISTFESSQLTSMVVVPVLRIGCEHGV